MKHLLYKTLLILGVIMMVSACTDNFDEINDNPNYPTVDEANPALILPKILYQAGNEVTVGLGWGFGNILAQLVSTNNFTGTDRYLYGTFEGTWNLFYRNLRDANNLLALGEAQSSGVYQASALTLRAWMLANLTEMWGDVPYSEALKGKEDQFLPKYDDQKSIYEAILADLEKAATVATSGGTATGDILYNGDGVKWAKLANTLRVRYLMRLENKWAEMGINGANEIQNIINTGVVFSSNADNGAIKYLVGTNRWPLNTGRVGSFDEKRMSQTIENTLKGLNDPRMQVLFRPVDNPDSDEYVGVPNGLSEDSASNFNGGANNQSRLGKRFREEEATVEMMIMNYSELMFILAEAAEKGYITGSAADYYTDGVTAAMQYLNITDQSAIDAYTAQSGVALGTDNLSKIATQKWLSLFLVGNEAWYDFRRTGLPALTPGPNASLTELPVRVQYPGNEQVLNAASYQAAVSAQGPDEITTKMWLLK